MNKTLVTLALGIGIGLLIAPDKGSVTLRKIKGRFDDLTDKAEDEVDELVRKGKKAFSAAKSKMDDAIS